MIKKITKIGNSQGIIFDQTLMDMAHLKVGDEIHITYHSGGSLTLMPAKPRVSPEEVSHVIDSVMDDYANTMQKLA